jgi:light-regulated signal transduction histidine kinase (bacteriophytochrome)
MGVLIDDLLQLSRLNRTEMQRQRVDLSRVAETIAARLSEEHAGRRIEFTVQPGMVAAGDPRLLEVALTNLLDNAVKFTGTRPHARVDVGQVQRDGEILYYVRDNGVGFDMAYAGTLFGPFQRLHKISEFPGTGIGLATVQRVIHRHGGHVWAAAEPDRGATFYFSLGSESEVEQTHSSD